MKPIQKGFRLHVYIATLFLAVIVVYALTDLTLEYFKARETALNSSERRIGLIQGEVSWAVKYRYDKAKLATDMLASSLVNKEDNLEERRKYLSLFVQVLRNATTITAAYIGYEDGEFFLVRRLTADSPLVAVLNPPPGTAYLVQSVERDAGGPLATRYIFVDEALKALDERTIEHDAMDPRDRPWFRQAAGSNDTIFTEPYSFFATREIGVTFARWNPDTHTVAAVDVPLRGISVQLRDLRPTPSSVMAIVDEHRRLLAASALAGHPPTNPMKVDELPNYDPVYGSIIVEALAAAKGRPTAKPLDLGEWDAFVSPVDVPGHQLYLATVTPRSELLADVIGLRNRSLMIMAGVIALAILLTLACSRLASRPLGALTREAAAIRAFKFDERGQVRSFIAEIDALGQTMGTMKATIRRFLEMGAALAGERDFDRLLKLLLAETADIAGARGAAIYLSEPDGRLRCALAQWDGAISERTPADLDAERSGGHPVVKAVGGKALAYAPSAAELAEWYPNLPRDGAPMLLAVGLRNRQGVAIGAIALFQEGGALRDMQEQDALVFIEALAGTAASAIETQRLLLEQKRLFEALIELIAGAIDRKSPYTGGHCQRVPLLAKLIAKAAEDAAEGPFAEFALTETQWEELHIASWLHDCGKVTSPEFVVDKATKLETIYDRLHEIRMRFEVVRREAEVACWKAIAEGKDRDAALRELSAFAEVLADEFAFLASCNTGDDFMTPDKLERLKQIAQRGWTRTFDDRIGLSHEELRRKARTPAAALPALETLLADRPEDIIERPAGDKLTHDNRWGFKAEMPENLYNRGELYNLSIRGGTLTAEERYKINEHVIESIRMLSVLPWPTHLSAVVEFAGGHHEKMDGTGYPRRLSGAEMSVPSRIMAIADIFEALTATDRPYKRNKTLSQSLAIMAGMRDSGHIDPDLFELFLSTGVYREFADACMRPDQIDDVDTAKYSLK